MGCVDLLGGRQTQVNLSPYQSRSDRGLQLAQQAKMQGTLTNTREETVKDFLQDWLQYRVQPRVRPRTFLTYQDQVNKHLLPSLGQIKLQRLTAMHVQKLKFD